MKFVVLTMVVLTLAGCGGDDGGGANAAEARRPRVVASFYPVFEAAAAVGGDRAEVTNLTPAGAEPHDLELTPRQVDLIEDADLMLFLGQGFQPAIEEVAGRARGAHVDLLAGLPLVADGVGADPHVWLDPSLMAKVVDQVQLALTKADPQGEADYAANATAYRKELEQLDGEYTERLAQCDRRVVITSHAAFGYLVRRYRLEQEPIAGLSPESEPDPKRLAELSDHVRATGSTTVFYETLTSPRIADTLAREAGVKTAVLNPIEGLTEAELADGETYLTAMRDNLAALEAGLGCGAKPTSSRG